MKRLVALVVAIGLVVGAVAIRRAIDDDAGAAALPGSAERPGTGALLCASDLGAVCDALGAQEEPPADTLAKIRKGTYTFDTWVTAAPWADLANAGTNVFGKLPKPVAASALQFYVVGTRAAEVTQVCGSAVSWACAATPATRGFFAYDNPITTTAGLLSLVALAASKLNTTDFGTNDFSQFEDDVARVKRAQAISASVDYVLIDNEGLNFSGAAVVTGIEAVASEQLNAVRLKGQYQPVAASPLVAAELVVVTRTGVKASVDDNRVKNEALKNGWKQQVAGTATLPAADVLEPLRQLWARQI